MLKVVHLDYAGLQHGKCCCHGQWQLHFYNSQLSLSMIATFDVFKIPHYVKIIIIVFNIETYLKYLLFDKLHELMDSNIFVILS